MKRAAVNASAPLYKPRAKAMNTAVPPDHRAAWAKIQ